MEISKKIHIMEGEGLHWIVRISIANYNKNGGLNQQIFSFALGLGF